LITALHVLALLTSVRGSAPLLIVTDLLVEDLEKWFPRSITQHVRITIIQSAAHILNTYDAKISDCTYLFPVRSYSSASAHAHRAQLQQMLRRGSAATPSTSSRFAGASCAPQREMFTLISLTHARLHTQSRVLSVDEKTLSYNDKQTNTTVTLPYGMCVWATGTVPFASERLLYALTAMLSLLATHTGIGPRPLVKSFCASLKEQSNRRAIVTDGHLRALGTTNVYAIGKATPLHPSTRNCHGRSWYNIAFAQATAALSNREGCSPSSSISMTKLTKTR
jgi:hypothetical protein